MEKDYEVIEEIKEDFPVYVYEESIPDILVINEIQEEIDKKEEEKKLKEEEVDKAEENKRTKAEEISIINTGEQIEEVTYNLRILRELNSELDRLKKELESIYGDLRSLEEDKASLEKTARMMVDESTKKYLSLVEKHVRKVDDYIISSKESDSIEIEELANELSKFKMYKSFADILKGNSVKEEPKEIKAEEKAEIKEEPKEEVKVEESKIEEVPTLNEVKIDELDVQTPEVPEVQEVSVEPEVKAETEVTPTETSNEFASNPISLDDLLGTVNNEVKEEQTVEIKPLLTSRIDKIADSNKKGINSTINVFKPEKNNVDDKKLALAA